MVDKRFPFTLKHKYALSIINIACSPWKIRLSEAWGPLFMLSDTVQITEEFYKEMRKACTQDQHKLLDKIFGKDLTEEVYRAGTKWTSDDGVTNYILASPEIGKMCLISMEDGNRWGEPIKVSKHREATEEEWQRITGNRPSNYFSLIE